MISEPCLLGEHRDCAGRLCGCNCDCGHGRMSAMGRELVEILRAGIVNRLEVCAWCGLVIHSGYPPITHGICGACARKHFPGVPVT